MSRFTNLAIVLSLAACETATHRGAPPEFPHAPAPQAEANPAEKPAEKPAEPPVAAESPSPVAETPAPPPAPAIAPTTRAPAKKVLKKSCNPMSRAGCRWVDETDEREQPRVQKKGDSVQ